MKIICFVFFVLLILTIIFIFVSTPRRIGISPDSCSLKISSEFGGIFVSRYAFNALGQIQGVGFNLHPIDKKIYIDGYVIKWQPLSKIKTHSDFPLFIGTTNFEPGKYSFFVWDGHEYSSIGELPINLEKSTK